MLAPILVNRYRYLLSSLCQIMYLPVQDRGCPHTVPPIASSNTTLFVLNGKPSIEFITDYLYI